MFLKNNQRFKTICFKNMRRQCLTSLNINSLFQTQCLCKNTTFQKINLHRKLLFLSSPSMINRMVSQKNKQTITDLVPKHLSNHHSLKKIFTNHLKIIWTKTLNYPRQNNQKSHLSELILRIEITHPILSRNIKIESTNL